MRCKLVILYYPYEGISVFIVSLIRYYILVISRKKLGTRYSVIGIATGYGLDDREVGIRVPVGSIISFLHVVQTGSRVHPAGW
jgi:hypothetical protein